MNSSLPPSEPASLNFLYALLLCALFPFLGYFSVMLTGWLSGSELACIRANPHADPAHCALNVNAYFSAWVYLPLGMFLVVPAIAYLHDCWLLGRRRTVLAGLLLFGVLTLGLALWYAAAEAGELGWPEAWSTALFDALLPLWLAVALYTLLAFLPELLRAKLRR